MSDNIKTQQIFKNTLPDCAQQFKTVVKATPYPIQNPFVLSKFGSLSKEILPPIVKSTRDNNNILIDTIVFIDSSISPDYFWIFYQLTTCEAGTPQLTIYICYIFCGAGSVSPNPFTNDYTAYSVPLIFTNKEIKNIKAINNIKTFVRNSDPETSRGTVTTVPPPTE
ncbi:hypothetical protein [Aquimarina algiphila]|uniref:Uncharacterized protein n=1 Tax=Aquimarina algiphila TaxID=2047982 RepID=A0A554VP94_9FLAO|nr:hypothetical protein [Aquimarina algiphila]TSE10218.1 hypothetical protein FOF46_05605 [Aquimarina algiphila]